jgi:hypothetical protein
MGCPSQRAGCKRGRRIPHKENPGEEIGLDEHSKLTLYQGNLAISNQGRPLQFESHLHSI